MIQLGARRALCIAFSDRQTVEQRTAGHEKSIQGRIFDHLRRFKPLGGKKYLERGSSPFCPLVAR